MQAIHVPLSTLENADGASPSRGGGGGGGGGNFHYKGIYRCAAGMGYTFQASEYMNGYHFYTKSISMGYLFHPISI